MSGEGFDRLWEAHLLKEIGLPTLAGIGAGHQGAGVDDAGTLVPGYLATEVLARALVRHGGVEPDPDGQDDPKK